MEQFLALRLRSYLCFVVGLFGGLNAGVDWNLAGDDAEELGRLAVPVLVLRPDVDELLKLPALGHGGDEAGELLLLRLEDAVDEALPGARAALVAAVDPLLHRADQPRDVVELGLFQNA